MGSLFKLRDYWTTRFADEEFDLHSMTVENLDNDPAGTAKIGLGSFQGNFRLLAAKQKGFQPDDVLFEMNVGAPIVQVGHGLISPSGARNTIILTPRKIIIGVFQRSPQAAAGGGGGGGDPLQRVVSWRVESEIPLEHTAYNFVVGAFGSQNAQRGATAGAQGAEQICVQSMDGQIAFFDIRKLLFARFLPSKSFMCPGALMYMPILDAIFTCSSTFELECYRVLNLASSTASETKEQAQGRKLSPDWSMVLGEDAVDIVVCRLSAGLPSNQLEIAVLTPHTLLLLKEDGTLNWNKRIEGFAACMAAYALPSGNRHQLLIGTHSMQVLVLGEGGVMWNAKTPTVPLSLSVAPFAGTQGMIAMLGDNGSVSVNYLGTDPANNPIPALESKDLDYDSMDEELRRLQQVVRQASIGARQEPKDVIRIGVSPAILGGGGSRKYAGAGLRLEYTGPASLQNVTITVQCALPLRAEPATMTVPHIGRGETFDTTLNFVVADGGSEGGGDRLITPSTLLADVVVCYTSPQNEPLTSRSALVVPLGLVAQPLPVGKSADAVIQLETNRNPVNLALLFEDLIAPAGIEANPNMISVQFANGSDASVLASKNAGKYRIQGSSFDSLWLITSELVRRLRIFYRREGGEELVIDHSDAIPLEEYSAVITAHFEARKEAQKARDRLADRSQQFRAIQKRLLVRFRERNPAPLNSLNLLFEETYRQVLEACDIADAAQQRLDQRAGALSCATHLMLLILRAKLHATMTVEDFDALRHYLSPTVPNSTNPSQYGWEESTDAAMLHLLKTTLSKSGKSAEATTGAPTTLEMPQDVSKLLKHIAMVVDRLQKGGSVVESLASKGRQTGGGAASPNAE